MCKHVVVVLVEKYGCAGRLNMTVALRRLNAYNAEVFSGELFIYL